MIPGHLIDKAVHAAGENWVLTFEWEHDKLHAQVHAALEAVAADIWGHGYNEGRIAELLRELGVIADSEQLPNPYRASRPHDGQPPQAYPVPHRTDRVRPRRHA